MKHEISNDLWNILICSYCGCEIESHENGAKCFKCSTYYPCTDYGSLDLRLKKCKKYSLEFNIGNDLFPDKKNDFKPLPINKDSWIDFSKINYTGNLQKEIISFFPRPKNDKSKMLDLGCGKAVHREICEHAGFIWTGLDYYSDNALILADAHSLPFKDNSFEFIFSYAVLEHIRFPFIVMREVHRVLQPGGKFIGTVAFLEPFHGNSFYHHTHLGIFNSLSYCDLIIEKIAPSETWSGLTAQSIMGLFPKMPQPISRAIVFPIQLFSKLWWKARIKNKSFDISIRNNTGAFTFIASKKK
ncbi:putative methyltransferase, type 11 [Candidatus Electronema halotolerans]